MGGPIDINADVFWKTYVDFLKSMVLQIFPKYRQIYVNFDVKSRTKFNCPQNVEKLFQYFPFEFNLQNSITAFLNDNVQILDVFNFEDIGQSHFHAKIFK